MNTLEGKHCDLEVNSESDRELVKVNRDGVTSSCLGTEHTSQAAAFCTRWSLVRFVAVTPYIDCYNSLFVTLLLLERLTFHLQCRRIFFIRLILWR